MPKDVVVVVNIDAKPSGTENLDILLLAGIDICGFIVMALASNYYFYHGS